MIEVIGISFNPAGKIYYFSPEGQTFRLGEKVIVETSRGVEMGTVAFQNRSIAEESLKEPLKPILRAATEADFEQVKRNQEKEKEAFRIANKEISRHELDMKLIRVEYTFDGSKILFYFTADGRVDFRELVKSLAGVFRTRIELRQIGVRDEAKHLGALGICGRFLCCSSFLNDFQPVSIKMAKEQGLSLNPTKISGVCGRLMCCLQYEQEGYEAMLKTMPKVGASVMTKDGTGVITEVNVLKGTVKVRTELPDGAVFGQFTLDEITVLKGGKPDKRAENSEPEGVPADGAQAQRKSRSDSRAASAEAAAAESDGAEAGNSAENGEEAKPAKPKRKRFRKRRRSSGKEKGGGDPKEATGAKEAGKPKGEKNSGGSGESGKPKEPREPKKPPQEKKRPNREAEK